MVMEAGDSAEGSAVTVASEDLGEDFEEAVALGGVAADSAATAAATQVVTPADIVAASILRRPPWAMFRRRPSRLG